MEAAAEATAARGGSQQDGRPSVSSSASGSGADQGSWEWILLEGEEEEVASGQGLSAGPNAGSSGGGGCSGSGEAVAGAEQPPVAGEELDPLAPPPANLMSARDLEAEVIELLRDAEADEEAGGRAGDEAFLRGMHRVVLTYSVPHGGQPWLLVEGGASGPPPQPTHVVQRAKQAGGLQRPLND